MEKLTKPPMPGLLWGEYPERESPSSIQPLASKVPFLKTILNKHTENKAYQLIKQVQHLKVITPPVNSQLYQQQLLDLQAKLRRDGFTQQHLTQAFCLISKAYRETMQIDLYDTQLLAAYYMLNNCLAEMATGEGKTYAVALAAATAALAGVPVHIITANDYLAERDTSSLSPLYSALGLKVGAAIKGQDNLLRKTAYAADITYCTAKELVFDYLRDKTRPCSDNDTKSDSLLSGLCMAMVDEADSILIDEASVPFILSERKAIQQQTAYYTQSLSIASQLALNKHFYLNHDTLQATLSAEGVSALQAFAISLPAVWHNQLHREESVAMALAALYLYQRDKDYVVKNNQVMMVDKTHGRLAEGRAWSGGLQQLIELKEACKPSDCLNSIAQITYQRFFPKYIKLGGISGTLVDAKNELQNTYGLRVYKVPLRVPSKRKVEPMRLYQNIAARNAALIQHVKTLKKTRRPLLIATESVQESETLSLLMTAHALTHNVLNAKHDLEEANRISEAGKESAITITTNMAGRGTDIKVSDYVNELGGLHVISCQVNPSKRIDRQLIGRTARHGQNGSAEIWITLESKYIQQWLPKPLLKYCSQYAQQLPSSFVKLLLRYVQYMEVNLQIENRNRLLKSDQDIEKYLSFGDHYD